MLEKLDQIDWEQLSHGGGETHDIRNILRALLSKQEHIRTEALDRCYEAIWDQGEVYEVASYTVPFLVEFLDEPKFQEKAEVLGLLKTVSTDTSYIHIDLDSESSVQTSDLGEVESPPSKEAAFFHATHKAVLEGVPVYIRLLSDENPYIRTMAAYVLATCAEVAEEVEPAFRLRLATESDPEVKATIIIGWVEFFSNLPTSISGHVELLESQIDIMAQLMRSPSEEPIVRFAAAFFLVRSKTQRVYQEAQSVLHNTYDSSREALSASPWIVCANFLPEIYKTLWQDPDARLHRLLKGLECSDYETCSEVISEIEEVCSQQPSLAPLVIPYFLKLIENDSVTIRSLAESALAGLGPANRLAIERLEYLVRHSHKGVSDTAALILKRIKNGS